MVARLQTRPTRTPRCEVAGSLLRRVLKERERVDAKVLSEALDRAEREVSFTSLQAAEICPMDAELIGKRLLREASLESVGPKVESDTPLEIAFHAP